jgi:EAL domain-containing protein (putative c-di-GMP-specific phosphodiesterase class I)
MDDFGTGQSAITYLRKFPVNTLKIDRSFVQGVLTNRNDAAITAAMVAMAHRLDLDVVAEGVEQEEQVDFLSELECEEYQGYLFSPAVPADDFQFLVTGSRGAENNSVRRCLPCTDLVVPQHSLVS